MTFRSKVPLREPLETSKEPPAVQAVGAKTLYIPLAQQAALLRKTSFQRLLTLFIAFESADWAYRGFCRTNIIIGRQQHLSSPNARRDSYDLK